MDIGALQRLLPMSNAPTGAAKNLPGMQHFLQMKSSEIALRLFKDNSVTPAIAAEMKEIIKASILQGFVLGKKYVEVTRPPIKRSGLIIVPTSSEGHLDRLNEIMTEELDMPPTQPE